MTALSRDWVPTASVGSLISEMRVGCVTHLGQRRSSGGVTSGCEPTQDTHTSHPLDWLCAAGEREYGSLEFKGHVGVVVVGGHSLTTVKQATACKECMT